MTFALEFVIATTLATIAICWVEERNQRDRSGATPEGEARSPSA
jgi:hypothetical protein